MIFVFCFSFFDFKINAIRKIKRILINSFEGIEMYIDNAISADQIKILDK